MIRDLRQYLVAVLFLVMAVVTGRAATGGSSAENQAARETVEAGAGELGDILADLLWLQTDRYHHIWMYQGEDWVTNTEYLPQLWMVIQLNPDFPDAYVDGGNHLAINLGMPEEGLRLLERGTANCPDNEKVFWERLIVLWQTGFEGPRGTRLAAWDYLELVRKKRGMIVYPWNEANASMIIGFTFRDDTLRRNSERLALRYDERRDATSLLRHLADL
ncbi:MAG: hypothetical protein AVO35_04135 [Candidatus Aegiribacteria sp. MLS_C]|nr:MAG: hypothetical protein AVO35_04135 [Candidatus Aegiribacteria sp. MLS_C]